MTSAPVGSTPDGGTGETESALALRGDLSEPFAGVSGGRSDVDLSFVAVQERGDEGVQLGSGGVGAGLLAVELGLESARVVKGRRLGHGAEHSSLANWLDKPTDKANTIGMTTTPEIEYALMVDWGEDSSPRYEYVSAQNVTHAANMAHTIYAHRPARVVGREVQPWRFARSLGTELGNEVYA